METVVVGKLYQR